MSENKMIGMLGLAGRSGKLVFGQSGCLSGIRDGSLWLIILDGAASANTRDAVSSACSAHNVPLVQLSGHDTLGPGLGRDGVRVIGIKDEQFAQALRSMNKTGAEV